MNSIKNIHYAATAWFGQQGEKLKGVSRMMNQIATGLSRWWTYVGIAIVMSVLNLLIGVVTLSYIKLKKEPTLFGLVSLGIVLALALFAGLCYLFFKSKDESEDLTLRDAWYSAGVVLSFAVSGLALTALLPSRCFSGPNEHFKTIGKGVCVSVTTMASISWTGVILMGIGSVLLFLAVRKTLLAANQPEQEPTLPPMTEVPTSRWLDRSEDPFRTFGRPQYNVV